MAIGQMLEQHTFESIDAKEVDPQLLGRLQIQVIMAIELLGF